MRQDGLTLYTLSWLHTLLEHSGIRTMMRRLVVCLRTLPKANMPTNTWLDMANVMRLPQTFSRSHHVHHQLRATKNTFNHSNAAAGLVSFIKVLIKVCT